MSNNNDRLDALMSALERLTAQQEKFFSFMNEQTILFRRMEEDFHLRTQKMEEEMKSIRALLLQSNQASSQSHSTIRVNPSSTNQPMSCGVTAHQSLSTGDPRWLLPAPNGSKSSARTALPSSKENARLTNAVSVLAPPPLLPPLPSPLYTSTDQDVLAELKFGLNLETLASIIFEFLTSSSLPVTLLVS